MHGPMQILFQRGASIPGAGQSIAGPGMAMTVDDHEVPLLWNSGAADPRLIAAAEECSPEELAAIVREKPGKPLAWYCNTALGRRRDAAEQGRGKPTPAPPEDPRKAWLRERAHELENKLIAIRHRVEKFGLDAEEAERLEVEAREQHRQLIERGPEAQAA